MKKWWMFSLVDTCDNYNIPTTRILVTKRRENKKLAYT